ncbi:MAG: hypothetical protein H6948_01120 [Zoogloeaceae bacterium]|nr:hypothetical protein [Zoogloeaceae bacterium]
MNTTDIIETMEAMEALIRRLHSSPTTGRFLVDDERDQAALDLCRRSMRITEVLRRDAALDGQAGQPSSDTGECDLCGEWVDGLRLGVCPACTEAHPVTPLMAAMLAADPVEEIRRAGGA